MLLSDRHVDGVERSIAGVAGRLGRRVEARLADDRVDADRRLAGRTIADDQLALAAANRNHRVDQHDAGLHRLPDRTAPDDPGRQLLDRIRDLARNRAFPVQRLAERVDDAAKEALADRHLQQLAGRPHLAAFRELGVVAEHDHADFGFVEVQGQAGDAVAEVEHLVQHDVGEPLDLGHAVTNLADHAHRLPGRRRFGSGDLGFDFVYQVSHVVLASFRIHRRASSAASLARTLASYTSLPTRMRIPPMSRGLISNDVSSP